MSPETWATIRQDWRESLPAVLDGTDDRFYPVGWATDNNIPRTIRTSLRYLCSCMKWNQDEICGRRRVRDLTRRREAIGLALQRRFAHKTLEQIGAVMNRERSAFCSMMERSRHRERNDPEFADLVKRLECLI